MKKKTIGLVLSGGGFRGLAHLGVIRVLEREGIIPDHIAGCSAGSLFGAMYAYNPDIEAVIEFVKRHRSLFIYDFTLRTLGKGLIKGERIIEALSQWILEDDFKKLEIPLKVNAVDLYTRKEVIISKGSVIKGVRASIAIPGVFTPVEEGNQLLVDGGVINPVPASLLKDDRLIIVDVAEDTEPLKPEHKITDIVRVSMITGFRTMIELQLEKIKQPYIIIKPDVMKWKSLDLKADEKLIKKGEEAAEEKIRAIKRFLKKTS